LQPPPNESQLALHIQPTENGYVPSNGIETAVITPDLLFKDLDVFGSTSGEIPLPPVPQPATK
jgi:hypothetical protein